MEDVSRREYAGFIGRIVIVFLVVGVFMVAVTPKSIYAQTPRRFYVAPSARGNGDCSSWSNACTLSTALSIGNFFDEFWLQKGKYVTQACLYSKGGYYGGFAGWESSLSQRDLRNNLTVISGDQDGDDITDSNGVVLDYVNIRGTNLSRNCTIGSATGDSYIMDGLVFTGFTGTLLSLSKGNHYIRNSVFSGNNAVILTIINQADAASITVENSLFRGNVLAMYSYLANKPTIIRNSLFNNNHHEASYKGGAIDFSGSPLVTIENSTFVNNSATGLFYPGTAGAVYIRTIANQPSQMPTIKNNTFANNTGVRAGGLWVDFALYTQPTYSNFPFQNNILANNTALGGISGVSDYYPDAFVYGTPSTTNYRNNLIKNVGSCTTCYPTQYGNILGVDPQLGPLQNNGGVTNTREPLPGSPAIDAGYNTGVTPDARGIPRPQDGNLDGIAVYDIGAVEFVPDTTPPEVSSITRSNASPTNSNVVNFLVLFTESVKNVDASDFSVTSEGITGAYVVSVTGSGTTYTVTVDTGSGEGWIRLDIPDSATINDNAGNPLSNKPFTDGESYVIDRTQPLVVSITRLDPQRTGLPYIRFQVVFSEAVVNLTPDDFTLVTTGTIQDAVITAISGSGDTYVVTVFTGYGNGTIRLDVK